MPTWAGTRSKTLEPPTIWESERTMEGVAASRAWGEIGGREACHSPILFVFFSCSSSCNYFSFSCSCALLAPQPSPLLAGHVSRTHTNTHTRRAHTPAGPSPRTHPTANWCPFPDLFRGGRPRWAHFFFSGQEPQTEIGAPFFAPIAAGGWGGAKPTSVELKAERERERERGRDLRRWGT